MFGECVQELDHGYLSARLINGIGYVDIESRESSDECIVIANDEQAAAQGVPLDAFVDGEVWVASQKNHFGGLIAVGPHPEVAAEAVEQRQDPVIIMTRTGVDEFIPMIVGWHRYRRVRPIPSGQDKREAVKVDLEVIAHRVLCEDVGVYRGEPLTPGLGSWRDEPNNVPDNGLRSVPLEEHLVVHPLHRVFTLVLKNNRSCRNETRSPLCGFNST